MSISKSELKKVQIDSISKINKPLQYHFGRFLTLEEIAKPSNDVNWNEKTDEERRKCFDAKEQIKYEIEAYINKLGKFAIFCFELSNELNIVKPEQESFAEVWDSLRKDGVIYELRNKWTAHRSFDKPRGEDDDLHLEVLLNLEGPVTIWEEDKFILYFQEFSLHLHDYHPKFLLFLDWFISEVRSKLETLSN